MPQKIFCIGLSGTGTKSLTVALRRLGLSAVHWPKSIDQIAKYAAAADITVTSRYKILDILFPGSKFILTKRDKVGWLDSRARKPLLSKVSDLWKLEARLQVYGCLAYDPAHYDKFYDEFHQSIFDYFVDRQEDLLTIEIANPADYERLCAFVGRSNPNYTAFPHVRRSNYDLTWKKSQAMQLLNMTLRAPFRRFNTTATPLQKF